MLMPEGQLILFPLMNSEIFPKVQTPHINESVNWVFLKWVVALEIGSSYCAAPLDFDKSLEVSKCDY